MATATCTNARCSVEVFPSIEDGQRVLPGHRGLLGHFFCASIEDHFEHLVSQWANRPPLGFAAADRALDPLAGSRQDGDAALGVPLRGKTTQWLRGFSAWTLGHEGRRACRESDFHVARS